MSCLWSEDSWTAHLFLDHVSTYPFPLPFKGTQNSFKAWTALWPQHFELIVLFFCFYFIKHLIFKLTNYPWLTGARTLSLFLHHSIREQCMHTQYLSLPVINDCCVFAAPLCNYFPPSPRRCPAPLLSDAQQEELLIHFKWECYAFGLQFNM